MVDKITKGVSASKVPLIGDTLLNKAKSDVAQMLRDNDKLHDPKIRKAYYAEIKDLIDLDRSNVGLGVIASLMRENERIILQTRTVRPMPEARKPEELVREMINLAKLAQGSAPNAKQAEKQLNALINDIHNDKSTDNLLNLAERFYRDNNADSAAQTVIERLFSRGQDLKIQLTNPQKKEIDCIAQQIMSASPEKKSPLDTFKKNREVLPAHLIDRLNEVVSKMDHPRQIQLCKKEFNDVTQHFRGRNQDNVHFERCMESVMKKLDARENELNAQKVVQFRSR